MNGPGKHLAFAIGLVVLATTGCIDYLDPGEHGVFRYFGEVRGDAPLDVIPPITDRDGNVYVLYGDRDLFEVEAFVGHAQGGWSSGCSLHKGDARGTHGWVGRAQNRAWYWSGDQLVEVSGDTGNCRAVLDSDPASGTNLRFLAVIPRVHETPSRTYLVAMIQSPTDPLPYLAVVDLDRARYSGLRELSPRDAQSVTVLGVGAAADGDVGFILIRYLQGGTSRIEALFINNDAEVVARTDIAGSGSELLQDAVLGYLQSVDGQLVVGLLETGELVAFDRGGGEVRPVSDGIVPVGVHRWQGELWLVGEGGGRPGVARLNASGEPGPPLVWNSSEKAAARLEGQVAVVDDRAEPRKRVGWPDPVPAIGSFPFVHAHSPDHYANETTGMVIAGPSYDFSGQPQTSIAFGPVGITYP